jgi:hypothetical protein
MTRVTLDLDRLVADGKLSAQEAIRLATLGEAVAAATAPEADKAKPQGRFIPNLLMIFGAVAAAAGVVALNPTPETGLVLGGGALGGTYLLRRMRGEEWALLAHALVIGGASGISAWLLARWGDVSWTHLGVSLFLTAVTLAFRSSFVAVFAVLTFGAFLGSGAGYMHAIYAIFVSEPLVTALVFCALCAGLFWLRTRAGVYESVTTAAARTSFIVANFGFWIGSLWGDEIGRNEWARSRHCCACRRSCSRSAGRRRSLQRS